MVNDIEAVFAVKVMIHSPVGSVDTSAETSPRVNPSVAVAASCRIAATVSAN